MAQRRRSSATALAAIYAGLVVYASLYPFVGWRLPGVSVWSFWTLPWPRWWTAFDLVSNLIGYLPLGALVFGSRVRSGSKAAAAFAIALLTGAALSFAMEMLQNALPMRVPSNVDFALNVGGTLLGALLGFAVHALGGVERWQLLRDRWFIEGSAGALTLLVLWPLGLLFPTPLPLAEGQLWPPLREFLSDRLANSTWGDIASNWLESDYSDATSSLGNDFIITVFALLAPCLLAFSVSKRVLHRLLLALAIAAVGLAATTLSTALNFGPQHALTWLTPVVMPAIGFGLLLAALLAWAPRRLAAGVGLIVMASLIVLVSQAPTDPYFAQSLQDWAQGRFIRFHGAAQWIGWVWPYVAMGYLLVRLTAIERRATTRRGEGRKAQQG